jgi:sigma-B regulation protein RsbU (phosphoserine phosphatase)
VPYFSSDSSNQQRQRILQAFLNGRAEYDVIVPAEPEQRMQCMEVWGGSQLTSRGVAFGGLDTWIYSKPHGAAASGGDVYYASSCATGRISRILLADVAGHGQSVAATALELRSLMRRFVNRLDQTEFVRLLNQQFAAMSRDAVFATAIVTTFFSPSRRLTICNAGHPRPFLYRSAKGRWEILGQLDAAAQAAPSNLPLGIIDESEYEQFDVELDSGDYVLSYTDALIESRGADGEMLGETGLLRLVVDLGPVAPDQLIEKLLAEIENRFPGNLSDDDATALLIRANGTQPRYSIADKLGAAARFTSALVRAVTPAAEPVPFPDWNLANLGGAVIPALGRKWRAPRKRA